MSIFADGQPGRSFAQHLLKSHFCHSTIHTLVPQWLRYGENTSTKMILNCDDVG